MGVSGQQEPSWLEAKERLDLRLDGGPAAGHSWRPSWEAKELGLHQPWCGEGALKVLVWEWPDRTWGEDHSELKKREGAWSRGRLRWGLSPGRAWACEHGWEERTSSRH